MSLVVQGFFFDLDGTLVDTYQADFLAYHDAIKEVADVDVPRDDFMKTNGMEMRQKLTVLAPGLPERHIQAIADAKKAYYKKYVHLTEPSKVLVAFLKEISRDHKAVLVTTAKRQNAELVLQAHGISQYFSDMVFGDEVTHPKPHPESYLRALELTRLNPNDVLAFEDSPSGVAAAEAAGIRVVHIRSFA